MFWEEKKGSERIHREDLGFGKLFEVVRDALVAADAKTQRIVLWTSAAIGIFEYSPSEALNDMRVEDLVPERFKAQHRAGMARYHETERPLHRRQQASEPASGGQDGQGNLSGTVSLSPIAPDNRGGP